MPLAPAAQKSFTKWGFKPTGERKTASAAIIEGKSRKSFSAINPGRDLVCLLLSTAAGVFEDFKYHREFLDGENAALEFSAHIGDVELKAVHLIRFNAAGEFVEIEKLVRPAEGVKALGNAMAALIGPQVKALRAAA